MVDHEGQVGLVEAHTEGRGGHDRLDSVGLQVGLELLAGVVVERRGVRDGVDALGAQELRDQLGVGDGQAVDDARPLDGGDPAGHPGQAFVVVEVVDGQVQRGSVEATTEDDGPLPQLGGDVVDDPVVGGRRGRQHAGVAEVGEDVLDPAVVGPEVVAPVGDAVGLVDHDHADACSEEGPDPFAEPGVVEALGADEQQVDLVGGHRAFDLVPLVDVRAVDRGRPDPDPFGCEELVAHEGQQRGDQQGGAVAPAAGQGGGQQVHGGLAPAGSLYDEGPTTLQQGDDRGQLVRPDRRLGAGELLDELLRLRAHSVGVDITGCPARPVGDHRRG